MEHSAGHEKELDQMKSAAVKVGSALAKGTKGFVKGVKDGFSGENR